MTSVRFHMARSEAVPHTVNGRTVRGCAWCGAEIDPIDWCLNCQKSDPEPCRKPHRRLWKRADAAFCDAACRSKNRSTFERDCLPYRTENTNG